MDFVEPRINRKIDSGATMLKIKQLYGLILYNWPG